MMVRILENCWLRFGLRSILGAVFIYAGVFKFTAPQPFADSIASFHLLPGPLISLLALGLPLFELVVGGLLLAGWWLRAASLGALGMTAVFAVALASAMARGLSVDCGCFGSQAAWASQGWHPLGRDLFLGMAAFLLYWQACGVRSVPVPGQDPHGSVV